MSINLAIYVKKFLDSDIRCIGGGGVIWEGATDFDLMRWQKPDTT